MSSEPLLKEASPRYDEPQTHQVGPPALVIRPSPKRWFVLFAFSWMAWNQCVVWFTWSSVPDNAKEYFPFLSDTKIDLLLNWGPIVFLPVMIAIMWFQVQSTQGLRLAFWAGTALTLAGAVLRTVPCWISDDFHTNPNAVWFLHFGQILNAISGPIVMGLPSKISAVWFPDEQRVLATAIASIANGFGMMCFLFGPGLADTPAHVPHLLYFEIGTSLVPVVCGLIYFPEHPEVPPSATAAAMRLGLADPISGQSESRMTFGEGVWAALANVSFVLAALSGGFLQGAASGWQGVIPQVLDQVNIDNTEAGNLGFANAMCNTVGGVVCGLVTDRWFRRRYKTYTVVVLAASLAAIVWWTALLPTQFGTLLPRTKFMLYFSISLAGFFQGMTLPIFYEMGAELCFPVPESTSGGFYVFATNAFNLIFLFVAPAVDLRWDNIMMVGCTVCCLALVLFVRPAYHREDAEQELRKRRAVQVVSEDEPLSGREALLAHTNGGSGDMDHSINPATADGDDRSYT